ncbi:hypothetical protein BH24ACT15_BH24ACT15_10740 [soil metagenome]
MSDPNGQPTQEEIEAYYAQLREAPSGELLMQAVGMLAASAEAKLGRPDARVLIDSMAAVVQAAGDHLGEAREQLQTAVGQLQTAQVQVEKQMAAQASGEEPPSSPAEDENATPPAGASPEAGTQPQPGSPAQPGQQKATDKLWIPGR